MSNYVYISWRVYRVHEMINVLHRAQYYDCGNVRIRICSSVWD